VALGSTSIFSARKKEEQKSEGSGFRFMPLPDDPELPWLASLGQAFTEQRGVNESAPFSLLELYARGSTLATNILGDICWKLDPALFQSLPKLIEATSRKRAFSKAPIDGGSQDGNWFVLSQYFKPMTDSTQAVLKTDLWMRRRLLSSFAGWLDSHGALLDETSPSVQDGRLEPEKSAREPEQTAQSIKPIPTGAAKTFKPSVANYLEPALPLYKNLRISLQQNLDNLKAIDYLPTKRIQSAQNLIALCQKFEEIAKKELSNNFVSQQDSQFLGGIDLELAKLPTPTASVLHLEEETITDKSGKNLSGVNLCIGNPGLIYVLLHIGRGETLSRGAVYTYYEVPGGLLTKEHWERKLKYTMAQPPRWTSDFEVQQSLKD
jgi:hypothetical protein